MDYTAEIGKKLLVRSAAALVMKAAETKVSVVLAEEVLRKVMGQPQKIIHIAYNHFRIVVRAQWESSRLRIKRIIYLNGIY